MAFRFRRSIRIAPGIRLNAGKRGMSVSVGGRGATMTFGPRGTYSNFGIPGTGLSWRSRLDGGQSSLRRIEAERRREQRENERLERLRHRQEALAGVTFKLTGNGALEVTDAFGAPLSRTDLKLAWEWGVVGSNTLLEFKPSHGNFGLERLPRFNHAVDQVHELVHAGADDGLRC